MTVLFLPNSVFTGYFRHECASLFMVVSASESVKVSLFMWPYLKQVLTQTGKREWCNVIYTDGTLLETDYMSPPIPLLTHLFQSSVLLLLVAPLKVAADAFHFRAESSQGCLLVQERPLLFLLPEQCQLCQLLLMLSVGPLEFLT